MFLLLIADFTIITDSMSDGGIWTLGSALKEGSVNLPLPRLLPNSNIIFPHFSGDEAFPLKTYMMRPYPKKNLCGRKRIFNYRLSRARRVIENSFGILTTKWRVLRSLYCSLYCSLANAEVIVKALICLHNFILSKEDIGGRYCPNNLLDREENGIFQPGACRNEGTLNHIQELREIDSNNSRKAVIELRDKLRDYVNSVEGQVEWQMERAFYNNVNLN
ncbi:uncharacterized protein LOC118646081 [Monomorium pharaonis]|uniref:uncharacterized protein LOC118646081 n=1 Tax=Monomorium pharaonis TaxID=307658 RepID=UPI0017470CB3|nr:uncharacterized protein LOC118646081 [Monomorium pharaonis]